MKSNSLIYLLLGIVLVSKTSECFDLSVNNIKCQEISIYNEVNSKGGILTQIDNRKLTITDHSGKNILNINEYNVFPSVGLIKKKIEVIQYGTKYLYEYEQIEGSNEMKKIKSDSIRPNNWDIKNILYS